MCITRGRLSTAAQGSETRYYPIKNLVQYDSRREEGRYATTSQHWGRLATAAQGRVTRVCSIRKPYAARGATRYRWPHGGTIER